MLKYKKREEENKYQHQSLVVSYHIWREMPLFSESLERHVAARSYCQVSDAAVSSSVPQPPRRVVLKCPTQEIPDNITVTNKYLVSVFCLFRVGTVDETVA